MPLIDTGAQRTCLTRRVIAAEQLYAHSKKPIQNVNDVNLHYLYWAQLGFWCESADGLGANVPGNTYFSLPEPTEVMDIANSHWFDALIGMDILQKRELLIERSGHFELRLN